MKITLNVLVQVLRVKRFGAIHLIYRLFHITWFSIYLFVYLICVPFFLLIYKASHEIFQIMLVWQ